jgi:hypothetical protein
MRSRLLFLLTFLLLAHFYAAVLADDLRPQRFQSTIVSVQPMTGIVLWTTNEGAATTPIQLEYREYGNLAHLPTGIPSS